ncbi:MAG: hypothetical protein ACKV0T_11715 [Planctomycetales bacterium]
MRLRLLLAGRIAIAGLMLNLASESQIAPALAQGGAAAAEAEAEKSSSSLAGLFPSGAAGYVEFSALGELLERIRDSSYRKLIVESPQFRTLEKSPQYQQGDATRRIVEAQLGMDLWQAGKELLRDRLAIGVYPRGEGPGNPAGHVVLLLRGVDPQVLTRVRQRAEPFLALAQAPLQPAEPFGDIPVWSIKGQAFISFGETWVAAASARDLLTQLLARQSGQGNVSGTALAEEAEFRAMSSQMGSEHVGRAFVNLSLLSRAQGSRLIPPKLDNPLASMFLGGITELAAGSPYLGLTLDVEQQRFRLTSGVQGDSRTLDEAHRVFFSDPAGPGTPSLPDLPSLIGGLAFHLDFANWYRQREQLLEARVLPAFDQFETGIGNLLPGKDVGEDVIPVLGRHLTFVAAPQDYSHLDGRPGMKFPGFGLVVELAKPEEGHDLLQLFFQTLSSIINLQAAQQNNQPWVMSSETYQGTQISYGRYLKKPVGDQLPVVYNFMPASARVGNQFIVTSSLGLCRQLVDQLQKPARNEARPNRNFNFEFHPAALADLLETNQAVFQARAIQQGTEPERAAEEFSTVMRLIRYFEAFRLSTSVLPEAVQVQFEGSWK